MKLSKAFMLWLKHGVGGSYRYLRAIRAHPQVIFWPGVSAGTDCQFGREVTIYEGATIANSSIGDHSYVGGNCTLKNCSVGKFCSIGKNVQIGLGIHPADRVSTYPGFYSSTASGSTKFTNDTSVRESIRVDVGSDVWIGNNALLADGVEIGHGAVIGAGAVVTRSVSPYSVVGGVPAKIIRMRFDEDQVRFLLAFKWWDRGEAFLKDNAELFADPEQFQRVFGEQV